MTTKLYEEREYVCGYCKETFREYVRQGSGSQVTCPRCRNNVKAWDGKKIRTVKADERRRKHKGRGLF